MFMVTANQQIDSRKKGGRPKGSGPTPASWKPGQTGNPNAISNAGKVARTIMAATADKQEELAELIVKQALAGCLQSQRLLVERFMPQVRAQTLAQPMPGIDVGSIESRLQVVLQAAAEGRISSDETKTLIDGINAATQAAALAAAEAELQVIRDLRRQALDASRAGLTSPQALEITSEVSEHERAS